MQYQPSAAEATLWLQLWLNPLQSPANFLKWPFVQYQSILFSNTNRGIYMCVNKLPNIVMWSVAVEEWNHNLWVRSWTSLSLLLLTQSSPTLLSSQISEMDFNFVPRSLGNENKWAQLQITVKITACHIRLSKSWFCLFSRQNAHNVCTNKNK